MSARSEKFINDTRSLDAMLEGEDQGKAPMLSDRGESAARMYAALDDWEDERRESAAWKRDHGRVLALARNRLRRLGKEYLFETLKLIGEHRNDRGEIIFKIFKRDKISLSAAKRRYMRHRDMLLRIFDVTFGVLDI